MPHVYGAKQSEKTKVRELEKLGYTVIPKNMIKCVECGNLYSVDQNNFWQSTSPIHEGNKALFKTMSKGKNGKKIPKEEIKSFIPYCKECLLKNFDISNISDITNLLYRMDIPYKQKDWMNCVRDLENKKTRSVAGLVGIYKKNMHLNYEFERFSDSDNFELISDSLSNNNNENNIEKENEEKAKKKTIIDAQSKKITNKRISELEDKYGYGFEIEEYLNFERKYKKITLGYKEKTSLHTERLITYIIHKVKEEMATAKGDVAQAKEWSKMAVKDAETAKLNVSQLSKSDITGGIDLLPQLVEAVEEMASVIPILPKVKTIPYDDIDMNIYAEINYLRRLEEKPPIEYKDVYSFYDNFIKEHFKSKGLNDEEIDKIVEQRTSVFKDLGKVYYEPLYTDHHQKGGDEEDA